MGEFITFDFLNLPAWNSRGGKVTKFDVAETSGGGQALLVHCPDWIADHIEIATGKSPAALTSDAAKEFTHGFRFKRGVPDEVHTLVENLSHVLSMPPPEYVDIAVALDWYTVPGDDPDTDTLVRTAAGDLIHFTKHASHPEWSNSMRSWRRMVRQLVAFIGESALYSSATAIVAAPGHLGDGDSFGERLAREVAQRAEIRFVESTAAPRIAQFEQKQDLTDAFNVQEPLTGTVIVLDDVYQSGGSASGAAAAARRAGANRVVVLTVARTIRG